MFCSGKRDQLRREARLGNFPGQPGLLRKGVNIDLENMTCVPGTKAAMSIAFSIILLIKRAGGGGDNQMKGILKKTCCALNLVKTVSRKLSAFNLIYF